MKDSDYDSLHVQIKDGNYLPDYTARLYEDDPIPYKLLSKYGLLDIIPKDSCVAANLTLLLDEKSFSILPVEDIEEARKFFWDMLGKSIIFSLKVDGINTRNPYKKQRDNFYRHAVSSSRGRETEDLLDFTNSLTHKLPQTCTVDMELDHFTVYGEFYALESSLPFLCTKYKKLSNPRSAGLSIARVPIDVEDYVHTRLKVFKVPAFKNTISESLLQAKELGFDTVPFKVVQITKEFMEDFEFEILQLLVEFESIKINEGIPADGVVAELDAQTIFDQVGSSSIYTKGNIALKFGPFSPKIYESIVVRPIAAIQRVNGSMVIQIEPVKSDNGNILTRVNCFNPNIAIRENLLPGNKIRFEYKSDNNINLVPSGRK